MAKFDAKRLEYYKKRSRRRYGKADVKDIQKKIERTVAWMEHPTNEIYRRYRQWLVPYLSRLMVKRLNTQYNLLNKF